MRHPKIVFAVAPKLIATVVVLWQGSGAVSLGQVSFFDNFNRPDNASVSGSLGQSGSLAPLSYIEDNPATVLSGNRVLLAGPSFHGGLSPNYDFNTASGITAGGGFTVSFDLNPSLSGNGESPGWAGFSAGHAASTAGDWYALDNDTGMAIGVILRDDRQFIIFDNGDIVASGEFDATFGGDESYSAVFTVATAEITPGGTATLDMSIDGTPVISGYAFTWNRPENYLLFSASVSPPSYKDPSAIDNIAIQSIMPVPEPSTILVASIAILVGGGMLRQSRRKRK